MFMMMKENFDADSEAEVMLPMAYSYGGFVQMRVASKPMERDAARAISEDVEIPAAAGEGDAAPDGAKGAKPASARS